MAYVFDLDGVIRWWDADLMTDAEEEAGLPRGAIAAAAFEPNLLSEVTTGRISDAAWREVVAKRLTEAHPGADGTLAVQRWSTPNGEMIDGVMDVVSDPRTVGPVCLLTNATDRLETDLAALGILNAFDHIFNSSVIGAAKPDAQIYAHIESVLGVAPGKIAYVDDSEGNVAAARDRGWNATLIDSRVGKQSVVKHIRDWADCHLESFA